MNPTQLLARFDRLADAPYAISRLRRFILALAVRGKLVEQDRRDEPASELLKRIRAANKRLRDGFGISPRHTDDTAYAIPTNWVRVPLGEIVVSRDGERIPVSKEERNTRSKIYDYYGASGVIDKIDGYLFDKPLLLIGEDGANLINRSTPIAFIARGRFWVNNHAHVLDGISEDFLRFIELHINAIDLKPYVTGTAQPKMNQAKMNSIPIALPPEAEQRRIVAKVDELMALCDRLEATQAERESRRDRLVRASLHRLNQPADAQSLRTDARFTLDHLPRLTTRPEHIPQLRQTILSLSVHGRIAAQDPNDLPARDLLRSIRKAGSSEAPSLEGELRIDRHDELPKTWAWARLGSITEISAGSTPSRDNIAYWHGGTIPWVASGATSDSVILKATEFVTEEGARAHRLRIYPAGTLLVALYGQGKTRGQVATLGIDATVNQACAAICAFPGYEMLLPYIKLVLLENYDRVRLNSAGGPQPNLNGQKIKDILVPLPPLAEQGRIVAKVDELMALCDRLEAQLTTTQTESRRLLEAVLHEALAEAKP